MTAHHYSNSPNLVISLTTVDFQPKTFLILYPSLKTPQTVLPYITYILMSNLQYVLITYCSPNLSKISIHCIVFLMSRLPFTSINVYVKKCMSVLHYELFLFVPVISPNIATISTRAKVWKKPKRNRDSSYYC